MVRQQDEDGIDAGRKQGIEVCEVPGCITQSALRVAEFFFVARDDAGNYERRVLAVQRGQAGVVEKLSGPDESAIQFVRRRRGFFAKPVPLRFQFGNRLSERSWQGVLDRTFLL